MIETTTEAPAENTEAPAETPVSENTEPKPDPRRLLDEFGNAAIDRLIGTVNEYNALAAQVKAATGDPQALLESLRESYTEDERVARITAAIEDLDNKREMLWKQRDELLKPVVEARVAEAKNGVGDSEAKAADMLKTINSGKKYFAGMYGEEVLDLLPKLVSAKAGTTTSGGGGIDGRSGQRIRGFDVFIDGKRAEQVTKKDGKDVVSSNLAVAAKQLGVATEDLREKFQAVAGTKDPKNYPATVEFQISTGEGEERKVYNIVCRRVEKDEASSNEAA